MENKKISIIIPTYNRAKKVKRCVNSIINQITLEDEIIIVDDCSTDNTIEVLKKINNKYSNIIIEKNDKNRGVSYSRNKGLEIATKDLILFLDSDDMCTNNMIQIYSTINSETEADIICSGLIYKNENSEEDERKVIYKFNGLCTEKERILENLLEYETKGLLYSPCNKLYVKEIIDKNNIKFNVNTSNMEDYEFNCQYIKYCNSVYFLNEGLYYYMNSNETSLSSKYVKNLYERYNVIKNMRNEMYAKIMDKKQVREKISILNRRYLFNCINNLYRDNKEINKKNRICYLKKIIDNEEIKEYNKNDDNDKYTKIMKKIIKLRNVYIIDIALRTLHLLKKILGNIYLKYIRKKMK